MNRLHYVIAFVFLSFMANAICLNPLSLLTKTKNNCPDVKPVDNLNISAFGTGLWHEIARYPNSFEVLKRCVSIEYFTDSDVNFRMHNVPLQTLYSITGTVDYAEGANGTGDLVYHLKYSWPLVQLEYPVKLVAIDYDKYAIFYSCFSGKITGTLIESAWVFTRTKTPDDTLKAEIDQIIDSIPVFDKNKFLWIDHSDALCKVKEFLSSLNLKVS